MKYVTSKTRLLCHSSLIYFVLADLYISFERPAYIAYLLEFWLPGFCWGEGAMAYHQIWPLRNGRSLHSYMAICASFEEMAQMSQGIFGSRNFRKGKSYLARAYSRKVWLLLPIINEYIYKKSPFCREGKLIIQPFSYILILSFSAFPPLRNWTRLPWTPGSTSGHGLPHREARVRVPFRSTPSNETCPRSLSIHSKGVCTTCITLLLVIVDNRETIRFCSWNDVSSWW